METTIDAINNVKSALTAFEANAADRGARARRWKNSGGVAGYVSNTVPLELIHAAGLMPLHLSGTPDAATPLADEFLEPAFDPWTRSIFERLLRGDYAFLDALVISRSNDAQQRLYYYLCEIQRKHQRFMLPPIFLVNTLHSPRESTSRYNEARFRDLSDFLSQLGATPSTDDLQTSIALYNNLRRQLTTFNGLRAREGNDISSLLAYQVYAAAQSLPPAEFLQALTLLCDQLDAASLRGPQQRSRLVLAGNGLDHPRLHALADDCGVRVVGDYHSLGNHFLVPSLVAEHAEPFAALANHYQYKPFTGRSFNTSPRDLVQFALQQGATGILFYYLQKEEALSWHYPEQQRAAAAAGMRTALLIDQPYGTDQAALTTTLTVLKS